MGNSSSKSTKGNGSHPTYRFQHGKPNFRYTTCYPMFNKSVFRLANEDSNQWAFYNDNADLFVHVAVLFDYDSQIVPLGSTTAFRIDDPEEGNEDDYGKYLCEVDIAPGDTQLFVEGMITGWRMDTLEARTSMDERVYRL